MSDSKILPKKVFAIRLARKPNDPDAHPIVKMVSTYGKKAEAEKRAKSAAKYSYEDETVEILSADLAWESIDTVPGDLVRK